MLHRDKPKPPFTCSVNLQWDRVAFYGHSVVHALTSTSSLQPYCVPLITVLPQNIIKFSHVFLLKAVSLPEETPTVHVSLLHNSSHAWWKGSGVKRCPMRFSPYIYLICLYLSAFLLTGKSQPSSVIVSWKKTLAALQPYPLLFALQVFLTRWLPGHSPLTKCVTRLRALFLDRHEAIGATQSVVFVYLCANIFIFLFLAG